MGTTTRPREPAKLSVVPHETGSHEWDEHVRRTEGGTFCHLWGWREIMRDVLGHECLYGTAIEPDGRLAGVLPLVRMRSRIFGHHLVSVPFLNYGGPTGSPSAQRLLTRWALDEARRSGAGHVELRARRDAAAVQGLEASRPKVTVLLELPDSAEALWRDRFGSKLRSQIRRPQKEGMTARFGSEQIGAYYEVFSRNMRDLGTPVLPRALFERLPAVFGEHVAFGAVYHGERPVAAGCGFIFRGEFEMTWASSLREYGRSAPNMLLYWAFMEEMIGRGVRVFNFGRCTPGGGTHRFKLQWGGTDAALPWTHWSARADRSTPAAERPAFRLATALWQRVPVPVANRIGPVLSRRIPTF